MFLRHDVKYGLVVAGAGYTHTHTPGSGCPSGV